MQQSNFIFAVLLIGFILFITNKGELGTYIQFLRGGGAQTPLSGGGTSGGGTSDTGLGSLGSLGNLGDLSSNFIGGFTSSFNSAGAFNAGGGFN